MKLGTEVGLGPGHSVFYGDPAPPLSQKGHSTPILAHVCCGQTAEWIKMPLGTEVGLGPGDIVLDGDQALPPKKGDTAAPPIFGPCLLWPNGWMDEDGTWYGGIPWPRPQCVHGDLALRPRKWHSSPPPSFWFTSTVAKRSSISATAELLF